jgi:hypothetical protein
MRIGARSGHRSTNDDSGIVDVRRGTVNSAESSQVDQRTIVVIKGVIIILGNACPADHITNSIDCRRYATRASESSNVGHLPIGVHETVQETISCI